MGTDMNKTRQWVQNLIDTNAVMVFSKSYCPYCTKAIEELKKFNPKNMHVEHIEKNPDLTAIQEVLKELTGKSSVPRIFIDKNVVGGCDDLLKEIGEGKLQDRLVKAGVV